MSQLSSTDVFLRTAQLAAWPMGGEQRDQEAMAAAHIALLGAERPHERGADPAAAYLAAGRFALLAAARMRRGRVADPVVAAHPDTLPAQLDWAAAVLVRAGSTTEAGHAAAELARYVTTARLGGQNGSPFVHLLDVAAGWDDAVHRSGIPPDLQTATQRGAPASMPRWGGDWWQGTRWTFEEAQASARAICWRGEEGDPVARALEAALALSPFHLSSRPTDAGAAGWLSGNYQLMASARALVEPDGGWKVPKAGTQGLLVSSSAPLVAACRSGAEPFCTDAALLQAELVATWPAVQRVACRSDLQRLVDVPSDAGFAPPLAAMAVMDRQGAEGQVPEAFRPAAQRRGHGLEKHYFGLH